MSTNDDNSAVGPTGSDASADFGAPSDRLEEAIQHTYVAGLALKRAAAMTDGAANEELHAALDHLDTVMEGLIVRQMVEARRLAYSQRADASSGRSTGAPPGEPTLEESASQGNGCGPMESAEMRDDDEDQRKGESRIYE